MTNYCTLFDHNYLSRGITLYESLKEHSSEDFTLYILAMDDETYSWLTKQGYNNICVQSLSDIKNSYSVLNQLQQERTRAEFSWTLSSFSIQFFLKKYSLDSVTYVDSDLCFYNDPQILFDELNGESVIITPHNYTPKYDQSATSGRYCVQFMYFKNNADGNEVLEWWRNECEKCCCGVPTDGKFGDQKYLDDWLSRFPGKVHEEKHLGCGVAPWNIQKFDFSEENGTIFVQDKITKQKAPLVFYHFHGLKELACNNGSFVYDLNSHYDYSNQVLNIFYKTYTEKLEKLISFLPKRNFSVYEEPKPASFAYLAFRTIRRSIKIFIKSFLFWKTYKAIKEECKSNKRIFYSFKKI